MAYLKRVNAVQSYQTDAPPLYVAGSIIMAHDSNTLYNSGNILHGMTRISEQEIAEVLHMADDLQRFRMLMMKYECAIAEVRTKLENLNRSNRA